MADRLTIITGDDAIIPVQLKKDNATFVIDPGATVKAQLRRGDTPVGSEITVLEATTGSAWATSLIVVVSPSADTTNFTINDKHYLSLEVQVDDSGKTTWILDNIARVRKGLIA